MNLTIDISGRLMVCGKHANMTYSEGLLKIDFGSEELSLKELRKVCERLEAGEPAPTQAALAETARRARWLTSGAAKARLGIGAATLHRWRVARLIPTKRKPGTVNTFLYDVNNAPEKYSRSKVPHDAR
jgi:hypothetical protein